MRLIDFNIFPRVPEVFAGTVEYVSAPVVTRRDVLLYLEHFKAGNGSVKLSANLVADSIINWNFPTREKHTLSQYVYYSVELFCLVELCLSRYVVR